MSIGDQEPERWPSASHCQTRVPLGASISLSFARRYIKNFIRNPPTPQMRAALEQWANKWTGADLSVDETLREAWGELSAIARRFC